MKSASFIIAFALGAVFNAALAQPANARAVRTHTMPAWYYHCLQSKRVADTIQQSFQKGRTDQQAYYDALHTRNPHSSWQPAHSWEKRLVHYIYFHPGVDTLIRLPGDRIGNSIKQGCIEHSNTQHLQAVK